MRHLVIILMFHLSLSNSVQAALPPSLEIISINKLSKAPKIPKDGVLSNDTVVDILAALIRDGYLDLPSFVMDWTLASQCFKAKALGENAKGVHSGQLFAISYNRSCLQGGAGDWRPLYILKETKKGLSEILNLHYVRESELGREKVSTKELSEIPYAGTNLEARISFEDLHFKLKTHGKTRYFSLLQTAAGRSLHSILVDFGAEIKLLDSAKIATTEQFKSMAHVFYRIGFSMSKLHQKYAVQKKDSNKKIGKTFIHGDFHAQNIFYDAVHEHVTLIDNETFAMSLDHKTSGVNDIVDLYLLHSVKTLAHHFARQMFTNADFGIDDTTWHALWRSLLLGYIEAFEDDDPYEVYDELTRKFDRGLSNVWLRHPLQNFTDQRKLKRLGPSQRRIHLRFHTFDEIFDGLLDDLVLRHPTK